MIEWMALGVAGSVSSLYLIKTMNWIAGFQKYSTRKEFVVCPTPLQLVIVAACSFLGPFTLFGTLIGGVASLALLGIALSESQSFLKGWWNKPICVRPPRDNGAGREGMTGQ